MGGGGGRRDGKTTGSLNVTTGTDTPRWQKNPLAVSATVYRNHILIGITVDEVMPFSRRSIGR